MPSTARAHSPASQPATTRTRRHSQPYFAKKSDWATWKAEQVDKSIAELRLNHIPSSNWRAVQRKANTIRFLSNEAADWRARAQRFRSQGN